MKKQSQQRHIFLLNTKIHSSCACSRKNNKGISLYQEMNVAINSKMDDTIPGHTRWHLFQNPLQHISKITGANEMGKVKKKRN